MLGFTAFEPMPAQATVAMPLTILVLCVVAGIGTVLVLPSRREAAIRKIGGVILIATVLIAVALLIRYLANLGGESSATGVYFWIFSLLAIFGAFRVVTHPQPVYSALYFVLAVMASAGLFVLLRAEFMAAALVIIYAGAILVTYVFVIMLAAQSVPSDKPLAGLAECDAVSREPVLASAVGFTLMGVLLLLIFDRTQVATVPVAAAGADAAAHATLGSTQALGQYLFRNQLLNLELAGVILTMAMVGSIVIARRRVVDEVVVTGEAPATLEPAPRIDDNPHSIPVAGSHSPRPKDYLEA